MITYDRWAWWVIKTCDIIIIHSAKPMVRPVAIIIFIWTLFCLARFENWTDKCENSDHYCRSASWIKMKHLKGGLTARNCPGLSKKCSAKTLERIASGQIETFLIVAGRVLKKLQSRAEVLRQHFKHQHQELVIEDVLISNRFFINRVILQCDPHWPW